MKTRTFTSKIYRCSLNPDGSTICALLEVKDITLSDLSIRVNHVNSFVCAYVRSTRSNGHYFVETSYNRGRVMCCANVDF